MEELRGVDLLPEPGEPKILSAIDPSTSGHESQWRAEVTGWAPIVPTALPYQPRRIFSLASGVIVALFLGIILLLWQSNLLLLQSEPLGTFTSVPPGGSPLVPMKAQGAPRITPILSLIHI